MGTDEVWMAQAACRNTNVPDLFFPPKSKGVRTDYTRAKEICRRCPVQKHCLAYSIVHSLYDGCWGGMSERERRHLPLDVKVAIRTAWWQRYPQTRPRRKEVS